MRHTCPTAPSLTASSTGVHHFAYLLWGATALVLVGLVRRRGSWLADVTGVLALLGISTMPGFLIADFYDSAIGREFGVVGALRVRDRTEDMWRCRRSGEGPAEGRSRRDA